MCVFRMMTIKIKIGFAILVLLFPGIWNEVKSQESRGTQPRISRTDSLMMSLWPEFPVPEKYLGDDAPPLPSVVNNAWLPWFPPVFAQDGWSCGQSTGIGYNFTFETNVSRHESGDSLYNQYQPHFTWNIYNNGEFDQGVCYYYSFELVKAAGHPNKTCFGTGVNYLSWMNGYENYHKAMLNKIENIYTIYTGDIEGITILKHWINDHLNGSEYGGVASYYTDGYQYYDQLPPGTPEEGKKVITKWGPYTGHAMTFVGYNDSIRFDYNDDGKYTDTIDLNNDGLITLADRETGGFLFVNSFGTNWADSGFCYAMYKSLADKKNNGGIWNQTVHVLDVKEEYEPLITIKTQITYPYRNKLKIMAGVSPGENNLYPAHILEFDHFNYRGGRNSMLGDTSQQASTIEIGLDITPLLSFAEPGQTARFFLIVNENDPENEGNGLINDFSMIDYTNGANEISSGAENVQIDNNDITLLSVLHSVDFEKPVISGGITEPLEPNVPYTAQLEAEDGRPPYRWELERDYTISYDSCSFPDINAEKIINGNGTVLHVNRTLPSGFNFFGKIYHDIVVHADGFISFSGYELPIPYQIDDRIIFRLIPLAAPWLNSLFYVNESKGDGVWYENISGRAAFRWQVSFDKESGGVETVQFAVILDPDGTIECFYLSEAALYEAGRTTGISGGPQNPGTEQFIPADALAGNSTRISLSPPLLPDSASVSDAGAFSCMPAVGNRIYNVPVKVTDYNGISSYSEMQLTKCLTFKLIFEDTEKKHFTAGESGNLGIHISNIGIDTVNCQFIAIEEEDEFIGFTNTVIPGGPVAPGESLLIADAFEYHVLHLTPDLHSIPLEVQLMTNDETYTGARDFPVYAPEVIICDPFIEDSENQRLDPGETAGLVFRFRNNGHASASEIITTASLESVWIDILGNPMNIDLLLPGESVSRTLMVSASENTPEGTYLLQYDISWYPGMGKSGTFDLNVGKSGCRIIDLDAAHFSGPLMDSIIKTKNIEVFYTDGFPQSINNYAAVFVCLGGVLDGTPLTAWQGDILRDYLLQGGNLYLEGARTWYNDEQTSVHPMFGVSPSYINWHQYDTIYGVAGSFAAGIKCPYSCEKPYFEYYLETSDTALPILATNPERFTVAAARDAGNYKTIASELEFGGLFQGGDAAMADSLLTMYLDYFGLSAPPSSSIDEINSVSPVSAKVFPNPFNEEVFIEIASVVSLQGRVVVRDMTGRIVREIEESSFTPGIKKFAWDGKNMAGLPLDPGIYFIGFTYQVESLPEGSLSGNGPSHELSRDGQVLLKVVKF